MFASVLVVRLGESSVSVGARVCYRIEGVRSLVD